MTIEVPDSSQVPTPGSVLSAFRGDIFLTTVFTALASLSDNHAMTAIAAMYAASMSYEILGHVAHRHHAHESAARYEFGTGKLRQALNLVLALAMVAGSFWLLSLLIISVTVTDPAPAQYDLLATTAVGAVCLLRFAGDWWSVWHMARQTPGMSYRGELKSATSRLVVMLLAQIAVTASAVAKDPLIGLWAQMFATAVIAQALMLSGANMLWKAVLDLIDHPLGQSIEAEIWEMLETCKIASEQVEDIRMRWAGSELFIELTVNADADRPLSETLKEMADLRQHLETRLANADVAIKLA